MSPEDKVKELNKTGERKKDSRIVLAHTPQKWMKRTAQLVKEQAPEWYIPQFQATDWFLPRTTDDVYGWARYFYRVDPLVATAIDIHSALPISRFELECPEPKITQFFEDLCDSINLFKVFLDIGLEYYKVGDVFPYLIWDESKGMWKKVIMFPPENIEIEEIPLTGEQIYTLKVNKALKAIGTKAKKSKKYKQIWESLSQDIRNSITKKKNIELDERCISHLAHKMSPYDTRGTPLVFRLFKVLMFEDALVEAQYAIAQRHITPLTVVNVGSSDNPPPGEELDNIRDQLSLASEDPDYSIVSAWNVKIDKVGASGSILDLSREREYIEKQKLAGLGISRDVILGTGPTYAASYIAYEALIERYESYRLTLAGWAERQVFYPVAVAQNFKDKDGRVLYPRVRWEKLRLRDLTDRLSYLMQATNNNMLSIKSFLHTLDFDYETEKRNLEEEKESIFKQKEEKRYSDAGKEVLGKIKSDPYLSELFASNWIRGAKYSALAFEEEVEAIASHFIDRLAAGQNLKTAEILCSSEMDNILYNFVDLVVKQGVKFADGDKKIDTLIKADEVRAEGRDDLKRLREARALVKFFGSDKEIDEFLKEKYGMNKEFLNKAKMGFLIQTKEMSRKIMRTAYITGILLLCKEKGIEKLKVNDREVSLEQAGKLARERICDFKIGKK